MRLGLDTLLRHNNEHIVVIPKLVYAANYLVTSGSNTGLIVYSLAVGIAITALLLFLARELLIDTPWRLLLCALLFPLVMFSAKLTHSYFLGMSGTIWLTADLFVILSAAALARAVTAESSNWLLLSLLAALIGVLAYSTAIYMLIVLVIVCAAKLLRPKLPGPSSRPVLLGTAMIALLVLGLGAAFRNAPRAKPDFAFDIIGLVEFVLIYLGNALTTGPMRLVAGLVILGAGIASIWRLAAERRIKDTLLWVILFFFAPFNALMTGIGRLGYGVKIAATSRYQSVTAITLIAMIVLVLAALPKTASSRREIVLRNVAFGALLACAAIIAIDRSYVANYTARNERKVVAEIAMRQGIEGSQHLKAVDTGLWPVGPRPPRAPRRQACSLSLALALRRTARTDDRRAGRPGCRAHRDIIGLQGLAWRRPGTRALWLRRTKRRHGGVYRLGRRHPHGDRRRRAHGFWLEGRRGIAKGNAGLRACPLSGRG